MTDPLGTPEQEPPAPPSRARGRDTRLVLTGVAIVALVWFAVANLQGVRIRFWLTSTTAPLIVVIVISGVLGAAATGLVSRLSRRRRRGDDPG